MRLLSAVKNALVPHTRSPRRVRFGLYSGIKLDLDLRSQTQMLLGLWERETYSFVRLEGANAEWFIDIGAGSGEMSLYFLSRPNPVKVVAVEPNAAEVEAFRRHLRLNGLPLDACQILTKQVGGHDGAVSLADLRGPLHGKGFIKIDVDGAEMEVLRSAGSLLDAGQISMLIETHSEQLETNCRTWLEKRGYRTSIIDTAWWRRVLPDGRVIAHNRWLAAVS
ncbi:FkbM family methyltransferase [Bradyrhizobium sp. 62]|uniref:FkbM family methyltransferase n=1 Tax=Bradyrhizobium sp. 62 TaxID=1043588 RepID=UPI0032119D2F